MAKAIIQQNLAGTDIEDNIELQVAGLETPAAGSMPDQRANVACTKKGYDIGDTWSRAFTNDDLREFNFVVCFDKKQRSELKRRSQFGQVKRIKMFGEYADDHEIEDPYVGAVAEFNHTINAIEQLMVPLMAEMKEKLSFM